MAVARYTLAPRVGTVPAGIPPILLGVMLAVGMGHQWATPVVLLLMVASISISVATMGLNDLSDSAYDDTSETAIRHLSGGSRLMQDGVAERGELKTLIAWAGVTTIMVALGLLLLGVTWLMLPVGAVGALLMVAYSYGLRLTERGWAQLAVFAGMGVVPVAAGYMAIANTLTWQPLAIGVIPGALVAATVMACHQVDGQSDVQVSKMTVPVRFPRSAEMTKIVFVVIGGVAVLGCALMDVLPPSALLSMPMFAGILVGYRRCEVSAQVPLTSAMNMTVCVVLGASLLTRGMGLGGALLVSGASGIAAVFGWTLLEMWLHRTDVISAEISADMRVVSGTRQS
ncbi:MAG: prenyltransferase [Acidimicrobiia bacterium]|nr:prenyltransferase [Acidimicrobiia bacterium]